MIKPSAVRGNCYQKTSPMEVWVNPKSWIWIHLHFTQHWLWTYSPLLSRHVLNCKWTLVLHTIIQENKAVWKIAFFQLQCTDVANEKELRAVTNRLKGTPRNLNSCNYLSICELYETQPILENHYVISILTNQGIVSYFTTIKMIEIHCCMDKNEKSLV